MNVISPPPPANRAASRTARQSPGAVAIGALCAALGAFGCNAPPTTSVVLENAYPASASPLVVYDAFWQAVSFQDAAPLSPGAATPPQGTVPCSANTAYVVLAPGWDPTSSTKPGSFVVLESREGFGVDLGETLDISVNDSTFVGNCAAASFLTQAQADFVTQRVFAHDFAGLRYDPATCVTTSIPDAGTP
jgi:hypothetical protein